MFDLRRLLFDICSVLPKCEDNTPVLARTHLGRILGLQVLQGSVTEIDAV